MKLNIHQVTALRCVHADLIGSLQAHEACDPISHNWEAHKQSIMDLEEAFPDLREDIQEGQEGGAQ